MPDYRTWIAFGGLSRGLHVINGADGREDQDKYDEQRDRRPGELDRIAPVDLRGSRGIVRGPRAKANDAVSEQRRRL